MRIGLTARGTCADELVAHSRWAEASGYTTVWYASATGGDPVVAIALAGRATSRIELGSAVLQTYPCHPLLQAQRVAAMVDAMGRPGFTLGVGPSHESLIRGVFGLSYDHPARSTEEYVGILARLLRGESVDVDGRDWTTHSPALTVQQEVPILVAALSPRLLRLAGAIADGTVLYLAAPNVIESRVVPQVRAAAAGAGKPLPRIVAGLPVAVHDDVDEARAAAVQYTAVYGELPNYRRVVREAGHAAAGEAAIIGNEASVTKQLQSLLDAGATDIWAGIFAVGNDPTASLRRTTDLLATLVDP
jgi:F420-dependent oxidoreductase-like protein